MSRVEPLLKTLQVHPQPPEALIQAYLVHIADLSDTNFRKVLELKGIKNKSEQARLVELYQMHKLSERYKSNIVEKSPLLSGLNMPGVAPPAATTVVPGLGQRGVGIGSASFNTTTLPTNVKFDPRVLGDAIMDRFAHPGLGSIGSTPKDGTQSPANVETGSNSAATPNTSIGTEAGAKLNENLKNLGKFFRRDLGGLGSRFGASRSPAREDHA